MKFFNSILSLGLLGAIPCFAQQQEGPPSSTDVAVVTTTYEVKILINTEQLGKNAKYQALLKQCCIEDGDIAAKESLNFLICKEAMRDLKSELLNCGAVWSSGSDETTLRTKLTLENLEDVGCCFPGNSWVRTVTQVAKNEVDTEKDTFTQAEIVQGPPFNKLIGLPYKEAVELVKLQYEKDKQFKVCRLVRIDDVMLINNPIDDPVMAFEVKGGRVIGVTLIFPTDNTEPGGK